jgi:hypothetical protein
VQLVQREGVVAGRPVSAVQLGQRVERDDPHRVRAAEQVAQPGGVPGLISNAPTNSSNVAGASSWPARRVAVTAARSGNPVPYRRKHLGHGVGVYLGRPGVGACFSQTERGSPGLARSIRRYAPACALRSC